MLLKNTNFQYISGNLFAEAVSIKEIADKVNTPFYVYSAANIESQYKKLDNALSGLKYSICFAVKANSNLSVLRILSKLGAGMDVVSAGEYLRARAAGVLGKKIVFSGVGKTLKEMELVLKGGIRQFNVESEEELDTLSMVASKMGVIVPIAMRVNPNVDAKTHEKITTGKLENKFGVPLHLASKIYDRARALPSLEVVGIDLHIGSQLTEIEPYEEAFTKVAKFTKILRDKGHNISRIDVGGGIGIPYCNSQETLISPIQFGDLIKRCLSHLDCEIQVEPGRFIVGNAGLLVSSVIYTKQGGKQKFLILDAGMNDLIRPAFYDAYHEIIPVVESENITSELVDVVGPICESSDIFAKSRSLPKFESGDLVAFQSAGAYGSVLASEYNTRPLVPETLVKGDKFAIIRSRPSLDEIINRDSIPEWLEL